MLHFSACFYKGNPMVSNSTTVGNSRRTKKIQMSEKIHKIVQLISVNSIISAGTVRRSLSKGRLAVKVTAT